MVRSTDNSNQDRRRSELQEIVRAAAEKALTPLGISDLDEMQASYPSVGEDLPIYYRFLYHLKIEGSFLELGCRTGNASFHAIRGSESCRAIGVDKRSLVNPIVLSNSAFTFKNCLTLDPDLVASIPDKSQAVILIDSSHKYNQTKEEFEVWWPKIKDGGLLLMDDILYPKYGCCKFWKQLNLEKQEFESLHPKGWGFGVIIKSL